MLLWIGSGFGASGKFLTDNGSEFRDMYKNLNIQVQNTAAYSLWQNGLCKRNHAVIDDSVKKILEDNPGLKLDTAFVWARIFPSGGTGGPPMSSMSPIITAVSPHKT